MINILKDMWDDPVYVGDTVIASRPAGAGTTMLEFCQVHKINDRTVSLRCLGRDGNPKVLSRWESGAFTLQKRHRDDQCVKIVRYSP